MTGEQYDILDTEKLKKFAHEIDSGIVMDAACEIDRLRAILGEALASGTISIDGVNLVEENAKLRAELDKAREGRVALKNVYELTDKLLGAAEARCKELEEENLELANGPRCGDCLDTGLLNNRVEGDYYCTCITETDAYQKILEEKKAERISGMKEAAKVANEWHPLVGDAIRARIEEVKGCEE